MPGNRDRIAVATELEREMPTKDELFASRFFKAEGMKKPIIVEILHCAVKSLKNNEGVAKEKLIVHFVGQKQQFVCNAVNFDSIVDVTGETDSDRWVGHKICLYPTTTQLGNKRVAAIRVKAPPASGNTSPAEPSRDFEDSAPF